MASSGSANRSSFSTGGYPSSATPIPPQQLAQQVQPPTRPDDDLEEWLLEGPVSGTQSAEPAQPAAESSAARPPAATPMPASINSSTSNEQLKIEAVLERDVGVGEGPVELPAVLSAVAPAVEGDSRTPLRLVAVLDKSGSMRGDKLRLVCETMRFMLRHLEKRDQLGLVEYDTQVSVLAPLTTCDDEGRNRLDAALQRLRSGTQTNLSGGLLRGLDLHTQGSSAQTVLSEVAASFGNTYRLFFGDATEAFSAAPEGTENRHEWAMELRFQRPEAAALVKMVKYTLHPSFRTPVVMVTEPPFRLMRQGWGTFPVRAEVFLHDGRSVQLEHELVFGPPETFRTVMLPLNLPVALASPAAAAGSAAAVAAAADVDVEAAVVRSTFLFTDGLANFGIRKPEDLCAAARAKLEELGDKRCTISTFGFGSDHSSELLQGLAEVGGGTYSFIENEDQIGAAFGEALGGLLSTTYQNVRLSLTLAPGIRLARACTDFPVEMSQDGESQRQQVHIELGDLFAEERRDVLVTLALPARPLRDAAAASSSSDAAPSEAELLGSLAASAFAVRSTRTEKPAPIELRARRGGAAGVANPHVERHRNRFVATEALKAAKSVAEAGDLEGARRKLSEALEVLRASTLAAGGDAMTLRLLADLEDCMGDLRDKEQYRTVASKKMVCLGASHARQRCMNLKSTEVYSNVTTTMMKSKFQEITK